MFGRSLATAVAALALSGAVSCHAAGVAPGPLAADAGRVPAGRWGATGVVLDVAADRAATDFVCAHGTIDEPLRLDRDGRFDVRGTHVNERGGPSREGEEARPRPARYLGRVDGDTITLAIELAEPAETLGPYKLTRGATPRLVKCQ